MYMVGLNADQLPGKGVYPMRRHEKRAAMKATRRARIVSFTSSVLAGILSSAIVAVLVKLLGW